MTTGNIFEDSTLRKATGYDGTEYTIGDRVEIHPETDLWIRVSRYGVVVGMSLTSKDRVHVEMDKFPNRKQPFAGSEDTFRKI